MAIPITVTCSSCKGSGSRIIGYENGNPIYENPCTGCDGDGKTTISQIDDTLLNDMDDKLGDIKDKLDDIWEKLNE